MEILKIIPQLAIGWVKTLFSLLRHDSMYNLEGFVGSAFIITASSRLAAQALRHEPFTLVAFWSVGTILIGMVMCFSAVVAYGTEKHGAISPSLHRMRLLAFRAGLVVTAALFVAQVMTAQNLAFPSYETQPSYLIGRLPFTSFFFLALAWMYQRARWEQVNSEGAQPDDRTAYQQPPDGHSEDAHWGVSVRGRSLEMARLSQRAHKG